MKCVIAAGGLGTRLQNFRDNKSTKILLEVNGTPMINHQIQQLNNWGFEIRDIGQPLATQWDSMET